MEENNKIEFETQDEIHYNIKDEVVEDIEDEKKNDFYKKLRKKITDFLESEKGRKYKYGEYLLLVPDFFYLLYKLSLDKDVPAKSKTLLISAMAYYISPIDLLPEALVGALGFVDDLALAAFVLNRIINETSYTLVSKYWLGEGDLLNSIQDILKIADEMLGSGLWQKLKKKMIK